MRADKLKELKSIIEEYKTIGLEKVEKKDSDKFIKSEVNRYYLNNGSVITREKILKNNNSGSASIVIPRLINGEYLTVIEPRVHTKLGVGVGFPAGYIEAFENSCSAALRELKEETGYNSNYLIKLDEFYQDEGCSEAFNRIFLALDAVKVGKQKLDKDEHIKYMTFNISELEELVRMRYMLGVNSKLALEKLYTAEILMNNIKDTKDKVKVLKRIFKEEYNDESRKDN